MRKLLGVPGPRGPRGARGATGPRGPAGAGGSSAGALSFAGPNWGIIHRNTIKSPSITLGPGPIAGKPPNQTSPPFGAGSLSFLVQDGTEKAAFGNQVDFGGDALAGVNQAGFRVFTTGENGAGNQPSIAIEVDPDGAGPGIDKDGAGGNAPSNFSTLVYTPGATTANQWSGYQDGADAAAKWGFTGAQFNTPDACGLNGPRCTLAASKAEAPNATILSVGVTKGRDNAWQGAIDGLRINNQVFDFEPLGTKTTTP